MTGGAAFVDVTNRYDFTVPPTHPFRGCERLDRGLGHETMLVTVVVQSGIRFIDAGGRPSPTAVGSTEARFENRFQFSQRPELSVGGSAPAIPASIGPDSTSVQTREARYRRARASEHHSGITDIADHGFTAVCKPLQLAIQSAVGCRVKECWRARRDRTFAEWLNRLSSA